MDLLGPTVGVALQHLPVLVAGDERDLLDQKAGFEQPAGRLVAQVVEVQVDDLQLLAGASERRADRPGVVGKHAVALACERLLLLEARPRGTLLACPICPPGSFRSRTIAGRPIASMSFQRMRVISSWRMAVATAN